MITTFYTDGSAHPNPGPGGYGIVGIDENNEICFVRNRQYPDEKVTNNEMELKAILYVMIKYAVNTKHPLYGLTEKEPIVYSDSSYCVNIFNDWMFNWARNGWIKSSDGKPPENLEIIKAYYDLYQQGFRIDLRKVKGHANNEYNNLADKLATNKITEEEVLNGRK